MALLFIFMSKMLIASLFLDKYLVWFKWLTFTNSGCSFSICFLCVLTAISVPWYPRKNPHSLQLIGSLSFPQRYADWCRWRDCLSGKVLPHTHLCQDFWKKKLFRQLDSYIFTLMSLWLWNFNDSDFWL